MTRDQIIRAQRAINAAGLGPVAVDGVYGPRTAAAYAELLRLSDVGGATLPMPTPPAPKPWWTSRAIIGALATLVLGAAGLFVDLGGVDAGGLTDALVSLSTGIAGLLALFGSIRRQAPIDPALVIPGVRLPDAGRVRLPPNGQDPAGGYWDRDRNPLDP